jgi:hypothetical protein
MTRQRTHSLTGMRRLAILAVALSACTVAGEAQADRLTSGGYRLVGEPQIDARGDTYDVYFRLNRVLPRFTNDEGDRKYGAKVSLAGEVSPFSPSSIGSHARRCYVADVEPSGKLPEELRAATTGSRLHVAVRIRGVRYALRTNGTVVSTGSRARHALGC